MTMLAGKGAVVTGGSRGIGRAIVERLAADGASVVFNYAHSSREAAAVEDAVRGAGGDAHAVQIDLAGPGAVEQLMREATDRLDGLDILVNNAAVDVTHRSIAETDDEVWERTMTVNPGSAFRAIRFAAGAMRDGGRIVNISTLNTVRPSAGIAAYVASKGAIEQLTKVAAIELGGRGITVNAVCPGVTDTDLLRRNQPESRLAQISDLTPLGRLGQPADIADVVAMVSSPDARWLTGQIILATGGLT